MGLQINTNISALNALNNLSKVTSSVDGSVEKLSSGLRINTAADDPSGLIISQNLKAQIAGLNQAVSNSQDAVNVIQTADGALNEVNNLLDSIRTLAVHAGNTGVNDSTAVQADQTQIASALESIDRIASQTQFGTKNLLDGTSGTSASIVATNLVSGLSIGGSFGGNSTVSGNVTISNVTAATQATSTGATSYASLSAFVTVAGTVIINGQTISASTSQTIGSVINNINNLTSTTGVTASLVGGNVVLNTAAYGSNASLTVAENGTSFGFGAVTAGTNASATVAVQALVNNVTTTVTEVFTGGRSSTDSGLRLTDTGGNTVLLTEAGNQSGAGPTQIGTVTAGNVQFQIGANAGQTVSTSLGDVHTDTLGGTSVAGQNLSTIDVTTAAGATNALTIVDEAIGQISQLRASLGSFQTNVLASNINDLSVSSVNLSASESQISDTNVASEVVNLTKNQIIQQAATSVLAQANSAPQEILKLLQ